MGTHREGDLVKVLVYISADNGVTWYPRGGNPSLAKPLDSQVGATAYCKSTDAGVTWTAKQ